MAKGENRAGETGRCPALSLFHFINVTSPTMSNSDQSYLVKCGGPGGLHVGKAMSQKSTPSNKPSLGTNPSMRLLDFTSLISLFQTRPRPGPKV